MENRIDPTAKMGKNLQLGLNIIIEKGVVLGDNVTIGHNVIIYQGSRFGDNVFIMDNCVIGKQPTPPFKEHEVFRISKMHPVKFGSNIVLGTGSIAYAGSDIGNYLYAADSVIIREGCKIGDNVTLGKNVIVEHHVEMGAETKVQSFGLVGEGMKIGKNVFIGPFFNGIGDKYMDRIEEFVFQPPCIKDCARIGAHVVLMAGTTVGKDAVVGAGAVVTKDVPDYCTVAGVPAKIINISPYR